LESAFPHNQRFVEGPNDAGGVGTGFNGGGMGLGPLGIDLVVVLEVLDVALERFV
jgi:hypothetical protein